MNVKLTKRKAWELISRIHPRLKLDPAIVVEPVVFTPDFQPFRAGGSLEDCHIRRGGFLFDVHIANVDGGTPIVRYYHPDALNRDHVAEDAEKEDEAKQAQKEWVWAMGKELAHKLVDQYWEG